MESEITQEKLGWMAETLGCDVETMAKVMLEIQLDREQAKEERARQKAEAGGNLKLCAGNDCCKNGKKRCTGCYFVFYCGEACQRQSWVDHKTECRRIRKEEFKTVNIRKWQIPDNRPHYNALTKGHCIVQVSKWDE